MSSTRVAWYPLSENSTVAASSRRLRVRRPWGRSSRPATSATRPQSLPGRWFGCIQAAMEHGEFRGRIGRYHWESEPWWPPEPAPPSGAPNVVIVVLDDVGFAQLGCFGSDIATPTFDRLAAGGLRFANFHTTALCSP